MQIYHDSFPYSNKNYRTRYSNFYITQINFFSVDYDQQVWTIAKGLI